MTCSNSMEVKKTVRKSKQQWETMRDVQQLKETGRDSETQPATIGDSKYHCVNTKVTLCLFKYLYVSLLSLPELLYVSHFLSCLQAFSHLRSGPLELLHVYHCL